MVVVLIMVVIVTASVGDSAPFVISGYGSATALVVVLMAVVVVGGWESGWVCGWCINA